MPTRPLDKKAILVLDFSSSSVRALFLSPDAKPSFFTYNLPSPALHRETTVFENVLGVLACVEEDLKISLRKGSGWNCEIILIGQLASLELTKILSCPPIDPVLLLRRYHRPVFFMRSAISSFGRYWLNESSDPERVVKWLQFPLSPQELADYLFNLNIFTHPVPDTAESLGIKQALARERLRALAEMHDPKEKFYSFLNRYKICLIGSVFTQIANDAQAVSVFIDGIRPRGSVFLYCDLDQWLPCLLAIKNHHSDLIPSLLNFWPRKSLGTVVGLGGRANCTLTTQEGETFEFRLGKNEIFSFDMKENQQGLLLARTDSGLQEHNVSGGSVGLVIDTRPFDLVLPNSFEERCSLLNRWSKELYSQGMIKRF